MMTIESLLNDPIFKKLQKNMEETYDKLIIEQLNKGIEMCNKGNNFQEIHMKCIECNTNNAEIQKTIMSKSSIIWDTVEKIYIPCVGIEFDVISSNFSDDLPKNWIIIDRNSEELMDDLIACGIWELRGKYCMRMDK